MEQNKITSAQIKMIQGLYRTTSLVSQKANILSGYGVEHTNELSFKDAKHLIEYLKSLIIDTKEKANQMRRKILAMAHRLQWEHEDGRVNIERVDNWCNHSGYLKKPLNQYSYDELPKLVSQFKEVYKSYIRTTKL